MNLLIFGPTETPVTQIHVSLVSSHEANTGSTFRQKLFGTAAMFFLTWGLPTFQESESFSELSPLLPVSTLVKQPRALARVQASQLNLQAYRAFPLNTNRCCSATYSWKCEYMYIKIYIQLHYCITHKTWHIKSIISRYNTQYLQ